MRIILVTMRIVVLNALRHHRFGQVTRSFLQVLGLDVLNALRHLRFG